MVLLKFGRIIDDEWVVVGDDGIEKLEGQNIFVGLDRWRRDRQTLLNRAGRLGLRLQSDQSPALIENDLKHFDVVALEFPAFKDGRAFSYARLLRERYGFAGEIRAVGDVLRDQFLFMQRCGFDAFEVHEDAALEAWRESLGEVSVFYQPSSDNRRPVSALRHAKKEAAE